MARLAKCIVLLVAFVVGGADEGDNVTEPLVLELTSHNFSAVVDAPGARVLVEFYLPWCSFCKRLEPVYEEAARRALGFGKDDPAFVGKFARVNADAEVSLASRHGAGPTKGYPSLYWFADGAFTEYRGARQEDDLVDLVLRRGGPLVQQLKTADDESFFRLSYALTLVVTVAAADGDAALRAVEEVCRANAEARCGSRIANATDAPHSALILYRAADDAAVPYPGDLASDGHADAPDVTAASGASAALARFVTAESLPPVVAYTPATQLALFESQIPLLVFLMERGTPSSHTPSSHTADRSLADTAESHAWSAAFTDAAAALRGDACFATVDTTAEHGVRLLGFVGLRADQLPALIVYDKSQHLRYYYADGTGEGGSGGSAVRRVGVDASSGATGDVTSGDALANSAAMTSYLRAVVAGAAPPRLRSEEEHAATVPSASDTAILRPAVAPLVATNYAAAVLGGAPRKHVVVLYHAPWCVACDDARMAYGRLATALADDVRVQFWTIDVGVNEVSLPRLPRLPSVFVFGPNATALGDGVLLDADASDMLALSGQLARAVLGG